MSATRRRITQQNLSPASLAKDGDFRALAALTRTSTPLGDEALTALAAHAGEEEALEWLLALALTEAQWAIVAQTIPPSAALTERLVRPIGSLVKSAVANPSTQAAQAVAKLVAAVPAGNAKLKWARTLVREGPPTGVLHDSGAAVLSRSLEKQDRALLVKEAQRPDISAAERVRRIDALGALTTPAEVRAAQAAIDSALDDSAVSASVVGRVASRLDARWTTDWFDRLWPLGLSRLLTREFGLSIGLPHLAAMVRSAMPADKVAALYEAAHGLPWGEDAELAATLVGAGNPLPDNASHYLQALEGQKVAWGVLLADQTGTLASAFGAIADSASIAETARRFAKHKAAVRQLSEVAGVILGRLPEREPTGRVIPGDAWTNLVIDTTRLLGQPFLLAMVPRLISTRLDREVIDLIAEDSSTLQAFVGSGGAQDILAWATSPGAAMMVLTTCVPLLTPADAETLLDRVDSNDLDSWRRALEVLGSTHPGSVRKRAVDLVSELSNPVKQHRPDPRVVAETVSAALNFGLAREITPSVVPAVLGLIGQRNSALIGAGAVWAKSLDVALIEVTALVEGVVAADRKRVGSHPAVLDLRDALGTRLVERARDTELPFGDRAAGLRLASIAQPAKARAAALDLAGDDDADLNLAAAQVLANTEGRLDDSVRLAELCESETDAEAHNLYATALSRVRVEDAASALERVLAVTGQAVPTGLVTAVAPADGTDEGARIVSTVKEIVATSHPGSTPSQFITAATSLADELMFDAIVKSADCGSPIGSVDVARVRARAESNAGSVAQRQPVRERLPWVSYVGDLHDLRQAHATKKGEPRPRTLTDSDQAFAVQLIGRVVVGWMDSVFALSQPTSH